MKLTGVIVPLVTPFDSEEVFDPKGMEQLVAYVLEQGADAVMPTALTGEGLLLDETETLAVWDTVFDQVGGRIPVVPAIISTTTRKAVRLAREAVARGAGAVMVAPILPELYAGRSEQDVLAFYSDIANAITVPIILFNYPSLTGIDFVPELVDRLTGIDTIRYIKESSGDIRRVSRLHRLLGDRLTVICGAPNVALESLALGCTVWITGIMNGAPRSARQLMQAMQQPNGLALARQIYYRQILPVVDVLMKNYNPTGTIKATVRARGVSAGVPRRPGSDVDLQDWKRLIQLIATIAEQEVEMEKLLACPGN